MNISVEKLVVIARYLQELRDLTYRLMTDERLSPDESLTVMAQISASMVVRAVPTPDSPINSEDFFNMQLAESIRVLRGRVKLGQFSGGGNDNEDDGDGDGDGAVPA